MKRINLEATLGKPFPRQKKDTYAFVTESGRQIVTRQYMDTDEWTFEALFPEKIEYDWREVENDVGYLNDNVLPFQV